jgi:hypothetical protein
MGSTLGLGLAEFKMSSPLMNLQSATSEGWAAYERPFVIAAFAADATRVSEASVLCQGWGSHAERNGAMAENSLLTRRIFSAYLSCNGVVLGYNKDYQF